MTDKQQAFVEEYLKDLNATDAARRAGYSDGGYGRQLLTNPNVAAAIQDAQEERKERNELSQDWVLEKLVANVERAMQAEVVKDRDGNPTGEFVYAGSVANKALQLLGKHLGMFSDRSTRLNLDISQLTDEQLKRIADGEDPIRVIADGVAATGAG